jgi:hypothetical protein
LQVRATTWKGRARNEIAHAPITFMLTLTLDDASLAAMNLAACGRPDVLERLLKVQFHKYMDRVGKHIRWRPRYFAVVEYGEKKGRIHMHALVHALPGKWLTRDMLRRYKGRRGDKKWRNLWPFCSQRQFTIREVTSTGSAAYVSKALRYMVKGAKSSRIQASRGYGTVVPAVPPAYGSLDEFVARVRSGSLPDPKRYSRADFIASDAVQDSLPGPEEGRASPRDGPSQREGPETSGSGPAEEADEWEHFDPFAPPS